MRNLFDQYVHPENRLTHALVCCLAEDSALLASFLRWLGVVPPSGERLQVVEQRLPGEPDERSETSELLERRLPDAWIFTDSGWALLIEAKIASPIDVAQLRGHLAIAERRGFSSVQLLVLSPLSPSMALPVRCVHRRWTDLYRWACGEGSSAWARHLTSYLPIAEQRMVDDGYQRMISAQRNLVQRIDVNSYAVVPYLSEGLVYLAKITHPYSVEPSPPWADDYLELRTAQGIAHTIDDHEVLLGDVVQGWQTSDWTALRKLPERDYFVMRVSCGS